jgi:hypothetical protein
VSSKEAIRAEAEKLRDEGFELFKQGTAESLKQAIKKWEESLPLWRKAGDKGWEATILRNIAGAYRKNGNLQQALTNSKAAVDIIENLLRYHGWFFWRTNFSSNQREILYYRP